MGHVFGWKIHRLAEYVHQSAQNSKKMKGKIMVDKSKMTIISEKYEASVIKDENGNTIMPLGVKTTEYEGPNGEIVTEKIMENTVLDDGRVWNSSLALRPGKDAVFVNRCPACNRTKESTRLTLSKNMRRCYDCGRYVCSRCIKVSKDEHLRCRRCNRNHKVVSFFEWLFFEVEE